MKQHLVKRAAGRRQSKHGWLIGCGRVLLWIIYRVYTLKSSKVLSDRSRGNELNAKYCESMKPSTLEREVRL